MGKKSWLCLGGENMRFAVVASGYDPAQVDSCLDELDARLAWLADRAQALVGGADLEPIQQEAARLRMLLGRTAGDGLVHPATGAEAEAAELLAQARSELGAAQEEARQLREQVYAEALQARREFEAALHARRQREARVDEILRGAALVPADTPTAASGVPATRIGSPGGEQSAVPRSDWGTGRPR